jgi:hypothetical protein
VFVYFWQFFENVHIFGLRLSTVKVIYALILGKMLAYILGDFFTKSSGHPDHPDQTEVSPILGNSLGT